MIDFDSYAYRYDNGQQDQQAKADKVLNLIKEFKKNTSDDQRLFLNDLFKQIESTLK